MHDNTQHLYNNLDLRKLLIPIIVEQLLSSLMGTADTMMVSNVGSAAISAVSLVDSINILVIQALSALSAGGAILCSQYLGSQNKKNANRSARQVLFVMVILSVTLSVFCLIFRDPLLHVIFGKVERDVMINSRIYFFFTLLSFPFIGLYDAGASIMRSQNNSRNPMIISVISNFMNIGGNAILIFVLGMGVEGAAISTLVSRIFCAIVVIWQLRNDNAPICIRNYFSIRPDWYLIKKILFIGIPSGIENSMFQFGKLAIQSTVSTLGTVAIAAQAMTNILENRQLPAGEQVHQSCPQQKQGIHTQHGEQFIIPVAQHNAQIQDSRTAAGNGQKKRPVCRLPAGSQHAEQHQKQAGCQNAAQLYPTGTRCPCRQQNANEHQQ